MQISIIGYYGGNFGDLLMLDSLIQELKPVYEVINIFTYGDSAILEGVLVKEKVNIYSLKKGLSILDFVRLIKNSRSIIWGGGTCFMDEGGTGGVKYMALARLVGVKVFYLGIGVDNFQKLRTRLYIKLATLISSGFYLRDEISYKSVKELSSINSGNIHLAADLAFMHSSHNISNNSDRYIVFCCRDLKDYKNQNNSEINLRLAGLALDIARNLGVHKIYNLICDYDVDKEQALICQSFFLNNGLECIKIDGKEFYSAVDILKGSTFTITSRLHPAVVSHNFRVPYSLYNYSNKNLKFATEVNETDRIIPLNFLEKFSINYELPNQLNIADKAILINSAIKQIQND